MSEGKPMYGIRGGLAHDAGSGSFVSWDNTKCNPLAPAREQSRSAWEDGYASAKREWVGLTESDRRLINYQWQDCNGTATEIIDLVEAKLRSKNNG